MSRAGFDGSGSLRQLAGLNGATLNRSWGEPHRRFTYTTEWYGGELRTVPAAYTSQTYSQRQHIDSGSRESQAPFH